MKDNFDDIIKNKWEQFHFPVDEDHRQDMIRLLDQSKRRKTGLFWWLGSLGVAVLLIGTVLIANQTNSVTVPDADTKSLINSTTKGEYALEEKISTQLGEAKKTDSNENDEKPDMKNSAAIEVDPITKAEPTKDIVREIKKIDVVRESPSNSTANKNFNAKKEITNKPEQIKRDDSRVENSKLIKEEPESLMKEEVIIDKNFIAVQDEAKNDEESLSQETPADEMTINILKRETTITTPLESLPLNLLDYTLELDSKFEPVFVHHHSLGLFAEAGIGFVPGSALHYSSGWIYNAGGGLDYEISKKLHLTFSSGYLLQKDGFEFEKFSSVSQPTFGVRSNSNTLSPDKLHFVYAKVGIQNRMRRHMVSLYGGAQYLYGAQGNIVTQTHDALTGDTQESKYSWLNIDGMQRLLWNAEARYGYQVTPLLSLQAGVKYTFTSLEAVDTDLESKGYYWNGKLAAFNPFFTLHFHLYGKR
ncbi:MAG TPA: hypothetical protein VMZ69_03905 [Saprospiraceae bacterium]|nr:hypothetical protein [Saprospiraceae bacterium]